MRIFINIYQLNYIIKQPLVFCWCGYPFPVLLPNPRDVERKKWSLYFLLLSRFPVAPNFFLKIISQFSKSVSCKIKSSIVDPKTPFHNASMAVSGIFKAQGEKLAHLSIKFADNRRFALKPGLTDLSVTSKFPSKKWNDFNLMCRNAWMKLISVMFTSPWSTYK